MVSFSELVAKGYPLKTICTLKKRGGDRKTKKRNLPFRKQHTHTHIHTHTELLPVQVSFTSLCWEAPKNRRVLPEEEEEEEVVVVVVVVVVCIF